MVTYANPIISLFLQQTKQHKTIENKKNTDVNNSLVIANDTNSQKHHTSQECLSIILVHFGRLGFVSCEHRFSPHFTLYVMLMETTFSFIIPQNSDFHCVTTVTWCAVKVLLVGNKCI